MLWSRPRIRDPRARDRVFRYIFDTSKSRDSWTYSNGIPVLVDHHDAQKHAQREEEQAVDVVLDGVADGDRESEEDDLRDGEEGRPEHDISNGPAVFERAEDEDELRHDVDHRAHEWPEDVDDPESDGLSEVETRNLLEGGDGYEERHTEHDKCRYPEELRAARS